MDDLLNLAEVAMAKLLLSATSVDMDVRIEADDAVKAVIASERRLAKALGDLIDGFPLPSTVNEYELVQWGYDPTVARKIAAAVAALRSRHTVRRE